MYILPDPTLNPLLRGTHACIHPTPAMLADQIVRLERTAARRARVYSSEQAMPGPAPVSWSAVMCGSCAAE
jgi:hypothetical protein